MEILSPSYVVKLPRNQAGFTLIELSIVLVIIGLIVGGILMGQDLIYTAQMRSVISDIDKITTAVNAFQGKYNCLPGDCANITSYFTAATNGNGDSRIDSAWWGNGVAYNGGVATNANTGESFQFWYHLQQAGLIKGSYTGVKGTDGPSPGRNYIPGTNVMATSFGSNIGYTVGMYPGSAQTPDPVSDFNPPIIPNYTATAIFIGTSQAYLGLNTRCCETYSPAFSPAGAYFIDSKTDDGLPGSGSVIEYAPGYFQTNGYTCTTTLVPSTAQYKLSTNKPTCGLVVWNKF